MPLYVELLGPDGRWRPLGQPIGPGTPSSFTDVAPPRPREVVVFGTDEDDSAGLIYRMRSRGERNIGPLRSVELNRSMRLVARILPGRWYEMTVRPDGMPPQRVRFRQESL